jgi:hypothetical protein
MEEQVIDGQNLRDQLIHIVNLLDELSSPFEICLNTTVVYRICKLVTFLLHYICGAEIVSHIPPHTYIWLKKKNIYIYIYIYIHIYKNCGAGSCLVEALCCKPEGLRFDS